MYGTIRGFNLVIFSILRSDLKLLSNVSSQVRLTLIRDNTDLTPLQSCATLSLISRVDRGLSFQKQSLPLFCSIEQLEEKIHFNLIKRMDSVSVERLIL